MQTIKLTNYKANKTIVFECNRTVIKWLWKNYFALGYDEIENLTVKGIA